MIGDKYRIECEIGRGGFGVVVRAIHLTLDQRVAIKVLTEGEGSTEAEWAEDAARFHREAKATAALRSEHVVRVLDVDVLESGYPYIVMEFLGGKTLHELTYGAPGPLKLEDAVDYAIQVLAALADAQDLSVVTSTRDAERLHHGTEAAAALRRRAVALETELVFDVADVPDTVIRDAIETFRARRFSAPGRR